MRQLHRTEPRISELRRRQRDVQVAVKCCRLLDPHAHRPHRRYPYSVVVGVDAKLDVLVVSRRPPDHGEDIDVAQHMQAVEVHTEHSSAGGVELDFHKLSAEAPRACQAALRARRCRECALGGDERDGAGTTGQGTKRKGGEGKGRERGRSERASKLESRAREGEREREQACRPHLQREDEGPAAAVVPNVEWDRQRVPELLADREALRLRAACVWGETRNEERKEALPASKPLPDSPAPGTVAWRTPGRAPGCWCR